MWLLTPQNYEPIRRAFPEGSRRLGLLKGCCTALTLPVYLAYPALLLTLWMAKDARLIRVLAVPAAAFVLCTVLRKWLDLPRPYDAPGFEPLVPRTDGTRGLACPSRHAASAFVIAFAAWYVRAAFGLPLLVLALLIAASRVLAGVHHPRDVAAGAALAAAAAAVGFLLI